MEKSNIEAKQHNESLKSEVRIKNTQIEDLTTSLTESKTEFENSQKELTLKKEKIKLLEASNAEYKKLKQKWVNKIFSVDPENEDLEILLQTDIEKLSQKHEEITQAEKLKTNLENSELKSGVYILQKE